MKRILIICYLIIIFIFSVSSVTISFANDNFKTFILELVVDVIFVIGVLIFSTRRHISLWLLPFSFAVAGECVLLITDVRTTLSSAVLWFFILLPAIYMNFCIVFPMSKKIIGRETYK